MMIERVLREPDFATRAFERVWILMVLHVVNSAGSAEFLFATVDERGFDIVLAFLVVLKIEEGGGLLRTQLAIQETPFAHQVL